MPIAFKRNITFKNTPEQLESEFNFNGGLVTDTHETKIANGQSPNLANTVFTNNQTIKTRNGYYRYNPDVVGITSDQANTGASAGSLALATYTDYAAQTFVPSASISTVQINAYLGMTNSTEQQYIQGEIWSTSAGAPLARISDAGGKIKLISGTAETAYKFTFRLPVALTTATTYALVLKPYVTNTTNTVSSVKVFYTSSAYASGNVYTTADGVVWTSDTAKDLKFVINSGGNVATNGLVRYYTSTGLSQQISKVGASLYLGDDNTGAMTQITLGSGVSLSIPNPVRSIVVNNTLLVADGSNYIQKYNGSTNANYSTGTITATNASATVTGSSTVWNTSTNAAVGEYIQLPDSRWYKITAIASGTSLTIERTYQGTTAAGRTYVISPWGEIRGKLNSSLATSGLVAPKATDLASHINRIWLIKDNSLYFSALDTTVTEEYFNDWDTANNAGQINIPSGNGDTGTGLYSLNGALYVFQRHAIWAVYGSSPANFQLKNITSNLGMLSKSTLAEWNNVLVFQSDQGLTTFDGSNIKNISNGIVNNLINSWASKTTPAAALINNTYCIAYTSAGGSTNDNVLTYDMQRHIFGKWTNVYISSFCTWDGGSDDGRVLAGSSNQGTVYRMDYGGNDNGYEIATLYDTNSVAYKAPVNDKTAKKFYIQQSAVGDWTMTVKQVTDVTGDTTTSSDIPLTGGTTSYWGTMLWGDSWSATGAILTNRIPEFQGIAKFFKYRFEQTGYNEGMEIIGILATSRVRRLR